MPRKARAKSNEAIYHIICRSMSEVKLFRDAEDKDYYLNKLKVFNEKYKCEIYAYCLMDSHVHLHFDPKGFDISRYMHCLNSSYVRYYNRKYKRHGHLFGDRFESRILTTDRYNFAVSAYIHNNAKDIEGYNGREEEYPYSSYGIYLGLKKDCRKLIDTGFMMRLFNIRDTKNFIQRYAELVRHQRDIGTLGDLRKKLDSAKEYEYVSCRNMIVRNHTPTRVISFISDKMILDKQSLLIKGKTKQREYRAFTVYVLRVLCGLGFKQICENMHNITLSACSKLCDKGHSLIKEGSLYEDMITELLGCEAS